MYKHILISTDGSALAQKGVEHGLALAKELGSKVTVITVAHPYPLQSAATVESWVNGQARLTDEAIARAEEVAQKHDIKIDPRRTVNESAAEAIIDAIQALSCDLVVMASHGRRGVKRLLLGSQTAEVVSQSPIPVLVIR